MNSSRQPYKNPSAAYHKQDTLVSSIWQTVQSLFLVTEFKERPIGLLEYKGKIDFQKNVDVQEPSSSSFGHLHPSFKNKSIPIDRPQAIKARKR